MTHDIALTRSLAALLIGVLACGSLPVAPASAPATAAELAADDVVTIVTHKADGSERDTKVWIVEVDSTAYMIAGGTLVTGASRWADDVRHHPNASLVAGGLAHRLTADVVDDSELLARVRKAMRQKYGWQDRFAWVFASRSPILVRLQPR